MRHALAIATTPKLSAQNIEFNDVARTAIQSDPDFHGGDYYAWGVVPPVRGPRRRRRRGGAALPSWCSWPLPSWVPVPASLTATSAATSAFAASGTADVDDSSPAGRPPPDFDRS